MFRPINPSSLFPSVVLVDDDDALLHSIVWRWGPQNPEVVVVYVCVCV